MINLTPYAIQNLIEVSEEEYDQLVQKNEGGWSQSESFQKCSRSSTISGWVLVQQNPRGWFFGSWTEAHTQLVESRKL